MKQVDKISVNELKKMAERMFGSLVKAVVDIEKNFLVIDAEMHADEEKFLLENGSRQESLWGINLYPEKFGDDDFVEFDSMINLRPSQHNRSRSIEDKKIRQKIIEVVDSKVEK
jgi:hypothetical protein